MKSVIIPGSETMERILPFYLAAEEWAAANLPAGDWFFAWQVKPTVICGRHQDMSLEVDLDYAARNHINVWRRRSGGGCVYADEHNVMFSYITDTDDGVQGSFSRYTTLICRMLATLGIAAAPTGRNDVAIDGRKVAGNAWYRSSGRSIVHGTMLVDADFDTMGRILTPSRAKLQSKGVQSVPSRVTTLRANGLAMPCHEFVSYATDSLCTDGCHTLTPDDIAAVDKIIQRYLDPAFLRRTPTTALPHSLSAHIDDIGDIKADWSSGAAGIIPRINLSGFFLVTYSWVRAAERLLSGTSPDRLDTTLLANLLTI